MKKRRKTVIAGDLVKVVEYTPPLPRDNERQRAAKSRATSEAQKKLNHRHAQGRLEETLAANFFYNDWFVTLTYAPGKEPQTRAAAKKDREKYTRKLKQQRQKRGQPLLWVFALEGLHGDRRAHWHAVINAADPALDFDELQSLWPHGEVHLSRLFDNGHKFNTWLDIARYMTKERPINGKDKTPVGAQLYSCSRGMKKPVVETEWIEENTPLEAPADAYILEREEKQNEYSTFKYLKYERRRTLARTVLDHYSNSRPATCAGSPCS